MLRRNFRIITSPTKKMRVETGAMTGITVPVFLDQADQILQYLQGRTEAQLKHIWGCSDKLVLENQARIKSMRLQTDMEQTVTPAILAYEGIQYQYMNPRGMNEEQMKYLQEHLSIISGFYGVLRPSDGIMPYRLEMQSVLPGFQNESLYEFWNSRIAEQITTSVIDQRESVVLNLASKEYSKAVLPYLSEGVAVYEFVFGERKKEKVIEKGTYAKMARGLMIQYLAACKADTMEQVKQFHELGFQYSPQDSTEFRFVFIRENESK